VYFQKDRFLLCVRLKYPDRDEEAAILDRMGESNPDLHVSEVVSLGDILQWRSALDKIHVDARIKGYILDLTAATRPENGMETAKELIDVGVSPRASLGLLACAKARAAISGRDYVLPEDVRRCAVDVLAHRIMPSFEAEARKLKAVDLIEKIVNQVNTP
jgi:MoxR-like ATPase